jgi:hypothetical protein
VIKPIIVTDYKKFYEGSIWKTTHGSFMKILNYNGIYDVTVQFLDYTNYITKANLDNIKSGNVKNPYRRLNHNGYFGE